MSPEEIEKISEKVAEKVLLKLGIDASTPDAVRATQADFIFLRSSRNAAESVRANALKMFFSVLGILIASGLGWLIATFRSRGVSV